MAAAPTMGHDVMFTLFGLYRFGTFFHRYTLKVGVGGGGGEGFLFGQVSCKYPADWLYSVLHGLAVKDNISTLGWQICQNNGATNHNK